MLTLTLAGQSVEIAEPVFKQVPGVERAQLVGRDFDAHHRTFMHGANLDRPVEIVTLRVGATLPIGTPPRLDRESTAAEATKPTKVFHGDRWLDCARHSAEAAKVEGPAVIEGHTATTWVPPGWAADLDKADNLILRRSA